MGFDFYVNIYVNLNHESADFSYVGPNFYVKVCINLNGLVYIHESQTLSSSIKIDSRNFIYGTCDKFKEKQRIYYSTIFKIIKLV